MKSSVWRPDIGRPLSHTCTKPQPGNNSLSSVDLSLLKMLATLVFSLMLTCTSAKDQRIVLSRLNDSQAVEAFVDSAEVVLVGFLEGEDSRGYKELLAAAKKVSSVPAAVCSSKEVWAEYSVSTDTIALFRKADNSQENLVVAEAETLDTDGLVNFITINEVRYVTEYDQVTAVGLFNSEVQTHLVILANRGSDDYSQLKDKLGALAPEFTGKFLFVLINGALKSNSRSLGFFGLESKDLPRVGIYDGKSDMRWLLPEGAITVERVRRFCQSFITGELKNVEQAGVTKAKTEL